MAIKQQELYLVGEDTADNVALQVGHSQLYRLSISPRSDRRSRTSPRYARSKIWKPLKLTGSTYRTGKRMKVEYLPNAIRL